ncbi:hypothetical protein AB1Y20_015443 [Prymnesium parvum]|uniref:Ubiquinone biosynthesis protein n=1 Tax=Prymnesium parvum TaxID=97485 RepID=A0AB34K079_PRYPA|eukprot:CAMPEP_0182821040 /NCGR_PEP_ID=MMETSP0006_2-20121128/13450_1 /TAXON_ID=97485 /ORGANISM="Prymnesium parvum, Strain Texoma1" /LENGTH=246 /DNA_ID=CAMNT_0024947755 /DNA_START=28 /DNA_END=768 /DNA_ORIENTATION=-
MIRRIGPLAASRVGGAVRLGAARICAPPRATEPPSDPKPPPPPPPAEEPSPPDDSELRRRVLEAALEAVPSKGWSVAALSHGAVACGLSPMAHGLCPRGPIELVEHFSAECDAKLQAELLARSEELKELEVHNRLQLAIQSRLKMVAPYSSNWAQALALRALPANIPQSINDARSLASVLIQACGEDAQAPLFPAGVDTHVKQMGVSAVYGSAELYMLTDKSEGHTDTWRFVEQQVQTLNSVLRLF